MNQLVDVAVIELVGELLPRLEVEFRLVEAAAEPLAILRNEAGDETSAHCGGYQHYPVEQSSDDRHRRALLHAARRVREPLRSSRAARCRQ